jgi:PRTRC genetic system protein B
MNEEEALRPSLRPQLRPQLRLDFYETAVILSRWGAGGQMSAYPVAVQDVVSACTGVTLRSGLLPPETLFWQQRGNATTLAIYVAARRWQVQTARQSYHIPLPPLLFVGRGTVYEVYAVKKRPFAPTTPLYHAPCPNVFGHGGICVGNTPFPACSAATIGQALTLFWQGSQFNGHLSQGKSQSYPEDVRRLWAELDGRRRFPLAELVPMNRTLRDLL